MSSVCQHQRYYSIVIDDFTILHSEGANNGKIKPRMPNDAVEITRSGQLILEWSEMFA